MKIRKVISDAVQRTTVGRRTWNVYVRCASRVDTLKASPVYKEAACLLREYEYATREKLEAVQTSYLKRTIETARKHTQYYKGILPRDFQRLDDLSLIPFLSKGIIRENRTMLLSQSVRKSRFVAVHTSGSTSMPLSLFWDRQRTEQWEKAFLHHYLGWHGIASNGRCLMIRATIHDSRDGYQYLRPNTLSISSDAYRSDMIHKICDVAQAHDPDYIYALPSNLYLFTRLLIHDNIRLRIRPRVIITSSEKMYPRQRQLFEGYYNVPIMDLYGNTERTNHIVQCEAGQYHINPLYSYTELVSENGKPCGVGEAGEVVGTTFNNDAMPLLRYRTEDRAVHANGPCTCGRNWPIIDQLMGKISEYIVTKDNRLVVVNTLWGLHLDYGPDVVEFELEQYVPGVVEMYVASLKQLTDEHLSALQRKVNVIDGVDVVVRQRNVKPRTGRDKYTMLKQRIPLAHAYLDGSGSDTGIWKMHER